MEILAIEDGHEVEWACVAGHTPWQDSRFRFQVEGLEDGRSRLRFWQEYAVELADDYYGVYNFNLGLLPGKPAAAVCDRRRQAVPGRTLTRQRRDDVADQADRVTRLSTARPGADRERQTRFAGGPRPPPAAAAQDGTMTQQNESHPGPRRGRQAHAYWRITEGSVRP
jgi:hypothetical protein